MSIFLVVVSFCGVLVDVFYLVFYYASIKADEFALNVIGLFVTAFFSAIPIYPSFYKYRFIHPIIFAASTALTCFQDPTHYFTFSGLILFCATMFSYGYFEKRFIIKLLATLIGFTILFTTSIFIRNLSLRDILTPLFFFSAFGAMLFILFSDRIKNQARPIFNFAEHGIRGTSEDLCRALHACDRTDSKTIAQYINARMGLELKASYIDSSFSEIYKVLSVGGRPELKALLSRHRID